MRYVAALLLTLATVSTAHAGPITLELLPTSGAIEGQAGSTIGWGYRVFNGSEYWLELTDVTADPFQHATGDASPFDFAILAPGETHTAIYDAALGFPGLYQLTWDVLAPVGFANIGVFVVSGMLWDANPFEGANMVSAAANLTAAYAATVTPVPEPGTLLLMGSGAAIAALARRRRKAGAA